MSGKPAVMVNDAIRACVTASIRACRQDPFGAVNVGGGQTGAGFDYSGGDACFDGGEPWNGRQLIELIANILILLCTFSSILCNVPAIANTRNQICGFLFGRGGGDEQPHGRQAQADLSGIHVVPVPAPISAAASAGPNLSVQPSGECVTSGSGGPSVGRFGPAPGLTRPYKALGRALALGEGK